MSAHQIEKQMKALLEEFEEAIIQEWIKIAAAILIQVTSGDKRAIENLDIVRNLMPRVREGMVSELAGEIVSQRSSWSGGFSLTNMLEQSRREIAANMLRGGFGQPLTAVAVQTVAMKLKQEQDADRIPSE